MKTKNQTVDKEKLTQLAEVLMKMFKNYEPLEIQVLLAEPKCNGVITTLQLYFTLIEEENTKDVCNIEALANMIYMHNYLSEIRAHL